MNSHSIERSIKDRVKQIAKEQNRPFATVWTVMVLERWLARLHSSEHRDLFIFKGGMCLSQYLSIGRDTKDLDFLIKGIASNQEAIAKIFEEVSQITIDDGVVFMAISVNNLSHAHMKYPGFEIRMRAELGQTRTPIRIDIGIGDVVKPENLTIHLSETKNSPLFEKELQLWSYPPETIFAEKLETAIKRDALNSRMKDFHDLVLLVQSEILNRDKTKQAVQQTFKHRGTQVGPIREYTKLENEKLESLWQNHLANIKHYPSSKNLPPSFGEAVKIINQLVNTLID